MAAHRNRLVVEGELSPRYPSVFDGMTISARDGRADITGCITDQSHLQWLPEPIAGLTLHSLTPLETENAEPDCRAAHTTSRVNDHDPGGNSKGP